MILQGIATFPGIIGFIDCVCPVTDGISPSAFRLRIQPQLPQVSEVGTLTLTFGDQRVDFIDCKVDYGTARFNEAGEIWELSLLDRRWKWRFGVISGQYNTRNPDYSIIEATRKSPQDLARLLLEEMGEESSEVGELPNDFPPEVNWDCENPAAALQALCESLGCRICPDLSQQRTVIGRQGNGANLPEGGIITAAQTTDLPEMPKKIGVICSPARFTVPMMLEAVGQELDEFGTIKKIDELSYKPAAGWGRFCFDGALDVYTEALARWGLAKALKARELAERTVYRWYRVVIPAGGLVIPGYPAKLTSLRQLFLDDTLTRMDGQLERPGNPVTTAAPLRRRRAFVTGTWWHWIPGKDLGNYDGSTWDVSVPDQPMQDTDFEQQPFSIDAEHRMVIFANKRFLNISGLVEGLEVTEAVLTLVACVTILDPDTHGLVRGYYEQEGPGPVSVETPTLLLPHSEIAIEYESDGILTGPSMDLARQQVDYYIKMARQRFQKFQAQTAEYQGLVPMPLDGAIRQVTYAITEAGTTTTIARNTEHYPVVIPWQQRRAWEKQRASEHEAKVAAGDRQGAKR